MFSEDDIIYRYTRAQAIMDGNLIDVTSSAKDVGIMWPLALTNTVHYSFVEWSDDDERRTEWKENKGGRLWKLLLAVRRALISKRSELEETNQTRFIIHAASHDSEESKGKIIHELKLVICGGDDGNPVITIMFPDED